MSVLFGFCRFSRFRLDHDLVNTSVLFSPLSWRWHTYTYKQISLCMYICISDDIQRSKLYIYITLPTDRRVSASVRIWFNTIMCDVMVPIQSHLYLHNSNALWAELCIVRSSNNFFLRRKNWDISLSPLVFLVSTYRISISHSSCYCISWCLYLLEQIEN